MALPDLCKSPLRRSGLWALPGLLLVALAAGPAWSDPGAGTFAHVSDIHFNPFDPMGPSRALADLPPEQWPAHFAADPPGRLAQWGEDTNYPLLATTLAEIAGAAATADFVVLTGDLIAHRFPALTERALGLRPDSDESRAFAARTTIFVAERLRAALPDKPILVSLGNTDSGCGDYRLDPGGPYLEQTREAVRRLVGARLLSADFDTTYGAGGYYAAAHPTLPDTTMLVIDDALWSAEYRNVCGDTGRAGADAMMLWLDQQLAAAEGTGRKVWLLHHIPAGIDAYSTLAANGASCRARIVPMLAEPYASRFTELLTRYAPTITVSFAGHDHHDDYRLLRDRDGAAVGIEKIAPAISPVFGQNPGFHLFSYDRASGAVTDFSTRYLSNLATASGAQPARWREEYAFSTTYGVEGFTPQAVDRMWTELVASRAIDGAFQRFYNVSHGALAGSALPAYACAVGYTGAADFAACYCDHPHDRE